ncbi:P-loop containing nucleoside triphosphate hydrolase protein [Pavlovales sp. CCMP2436]|nr:P-loop containing nucleoside triphosphate hydrolase protein [Pavlovales sp. CCMP2436]
MPMGTSQLVETVCNLPQTIDALTAASIVDALADATEFGEGEAGRAFFKKRARWCAMQFADEAIAAHRGIVGSDPRALARQGKCVFGCRLSAGEKPGELVLLGGEDGGSEVRRGLSTGDSVSLRPANPPRQPAHVPQQYPQQYPQPQQYGQHGEVGPPQPPSSEPPQLTPQSRDLLGLLQGAGGWIECEVCNVRPLVLKPAAPAIARWAKDLAHAAGGGGMGGGEITFRVDKLANRVSLERLVKALALIAGIGDSDGNGGSGGGQGQGKGASSRMRPVAPLLAALISDFSPGDERLRHNIGEPEFYWPDVGRDCPAEVEGVRHACRMPFAPTAGLHDEYASQFGGGGGGEGGGGMASALGGVALAQAWGMNGLAQAHTPLSSFGAQPAQMGGLYQAGGQATNQQTLEAAADAFALNLRRSLADLNPSQAEAVEKACTRRLTLIQGPPGTGKTAVSVRILQAWCRSGAKCLATSDSNIAVDNVLAGLVAAGVRAVRLGRPEGTRPDLLRYSADEIGQQAGPNRQAIMDARLRAIKTAEVVCCTCVGAGAPLLDRMAFGCVLVDEACQATEPATLVPIVRGCQSLVLVGDQCQLPPTITSEAAERDGMSVSLFERLLRAKVRPALLRVQYRMHPTIGEFPCDAFYAGAVTTGIRAADRPPVTGFAWPKADMPVAFVHARGGSESAEGASKSNAVEAELVCRIAYDLIAAGGISAEQLGVISPYNGQVTLLRRLLGRALGAHARAVEVASVDGFQGREKEVVIVSTVRANGRGQVGFLSDWRRANVALTRAKRGLLVVGDAPTLCAEPRAWGPFLRWCSANELVVNHAPLPGGYSKAHMHSLCDPELSKNLLENFSVEHAAFEEARVVRERTVDEYGRARIGGPDDGGRAGEAKPRRSRWEAASGPPVQPVGEYPAPPSGGVGYPGYPAPNGGGYAQPAQPTAYPAQPNGGH